MNENQDMKHKPGKKQFSQQDGDMAARKLKAQRHVTRTVWSSLQAKGQ